MKIEYFDSHAHYDDSKFDEDRKEIIQKMYDEGVTKIISAGYNLESSKYASKLTSEYDFIYTTCGISPNDIPEGEKEFYKELIEIKELTKNEKCVAIGEIGLDYYWNKENKEYQKTFSMLSSLYEPLDNFFKEIMVMVDCDKLKNNRIALLSLVDKIFKNMLDFSSLIK